MYRWLDPGQRSHSGRTHAYQASQPGEQHRTRIALSHRVTRSTVRLYATTTAGRRRGCTHIFQLSVAALLPVTLVFLTTAHWSQPLRNARPLALAAAATALAFAAVYCLEHVYYPSKLQ